MAALPAAIVVLSACGQESSRAPLYGAPTPIRESSPIEQLCAIQEAFKNLPMPLIERMSYKGPWKRRPLGAATVSYRGFHRIQLRTEALDFLKRHARLETVSSLAPLIVDPDYGGEVAVLLAGIPAGTDAAQGRLTRSLAGQIHDAVYKSPEDPGAWSQYALEGLKHLAPLSGLGNTTSRIHERTIPEFRGSVEEAIVEVLRAYSAISATYPQKLYEPMENPPIQGNLEDWVSDRPTPKLAEPALAFVEQHNGPFAALVLLPLIGADDRNLGVPEHLIMWLLGLQDEYWPAMLRRPSGNKLVAPLSKAFRIEAVERLRTYCNSDAPTTAQIGID